MIPESISVSTRRAAAPHLGAGSRDHDLLATPLLGWLDEREITRPAQTIEPPSPSIEPAGLDIGF